MKLTAGPEFLVYCPDNEYSVIERLGEADYSYYFVMKRFLPLLQGIGAVTELTCLGDLSEACAESRAAQREPLGLVFAPPHRMPPTADCDLLPVFAWEFDTIPSESWDEDPNQNWAEVLIGLPGAISHSRHTINAVRRALGESYPIASLPAPVWDEFVDLAQTPWTGEPRMVVFRGTLLDSRGLGLDAEPTFQPMVFETDDQILALSGVVFSSIANPNDGRKNWLDQLTAFVWTFREDPSVTLVFKLVNHDRDHVCAALLLEMRKLAPFRCRVVVIQGFLQDATYDELIRATTYAVNSSRGEGQCLPLMEFMAAGRPAIAPTHTALAEYVNDDNAFTLRSSLEWTFWPQDPRRRLTCMSHQIDWDSLCEAYSEAAHVALYDPVRYTAMARHATATLERHCARKFIAESFKHFVDSLSLLSD